MLRVIHCLVLAVVVLILAAGDAKPQAASPYTGGNRLAYLDEINPYYPHRDFAKLITPQWVGEEGVEAVVILSIDDMRDPVRYEQYLRPILDRLKKVPNSQGKAPLSIFTNSVNPDHPQLQTWLKEGLSFEVHTITHPCPCLGTGPAPTGDIHRAKQTYDGCVDLLHQIPNYKGPVAFRMPCCDSMNSVSPRFFAEVMNKTTAKGHFLSIDSSVFNIFTSDDPALPRELVLDKDAEGKPRERFKKYTQFPGYINTIENYPYPYVIGNTIWQFPCVVPSDWEAQHLQGKNNPKTVEDMKAALDCTVIKQGVFTLVFHPHGWIQAQQIIELIDHAEKKHGKKVRFLNFQEALERINKNALAGEALRNKLGADNDLQLRPDDAGLMKVRSMVSHDKRKWHERNWSATEKRWDSWTFYPPNAPPRKQEAPIVSAERQIDLNGDGEADRIYSDGDRYSVSLYDANLKSHRALFEFKRGVLPSAKELPPIIRADGTNNGFFIKGDALYWQNEDTGGEEPHHVRKITFKEVLALADAKPQARELQAPVPASPAHNFTTAHATPPPPRSPEASRDSIVLIPGFRAELVAAEPLVMDPIAFDFGPDGRLWVVEMGDYPSGAPDADGRMKPAGRVVFLEDTNGDGKYDKRTVFLEELNFPTGIMVWNKGVLITAAPDIFYAEDSTPDDANRKADKRVTLFTGFGEGNQQHRVSGMRWGMDGWVYVANGDSGGTVVPRRAQPRFSKSNIETSINGRDLRIRPDIETFQRITEIVDAQSGQSQFGRDRDDFGNWFGSNNPNPGWHYALEDHYLRRNPHVAAPNPRVDLTGDRAVFPISIVHSPSIENHRFTPGAGQSAVHSSACSLTIYRDDFYGAAFTSNAFVSEPVHNLVRRMILKPHGVTFRAERPPGEEKRDFLASTDPWFRPTTIRTGPDGCLWIADMYRQTIEHPQWIPPDWQKTLDLRAGHDKGRIYRIVPVATKPRTPVRLDKLDAKGLVAAMDSPSGWQRDMVQMMLMWRVHRQTIPVEIQEKLKEMRMDLRILAAGTEPYRRKERELHDLLGTLPLFTPLTLIAAKAKHPAGRAQALHALDGLGLLASEIILTALRDSHPGVRKAALQLSEMRRTQMVAIGSFAAPATHVEIRSDAGAHAFTLSDFDAALKLADDAEPSVRQQLAYSIGEWTDPSAGKALAQILLKDTNDPYIVAACMSSVLPHLDTVMQHLLTQHGGIGPHSKLVAQLIDIAVAADKLESLGAMLDAVTMPQGDKFHAWQFASLSRLLDAMAKRKLTLGAMYEQAQTKNDRRLMRTLDRVPNVLTVARAAIVDAGQDESLRLAAIDLFARQGGEQRAATFAAALADVKSSPAVQQAAAAAMARLGDARAFTAMLAGWKGYGPALRVSILDGLLRSDAGVRVLLDAMEQQIISRHDIDLPRRQPLLAHKDVALRELAAKLLGGAPDADRQKVIDSYAKAMALLPREAAAGDRTRGEEVFMKNCAVCHKPATGAAIGPELSKILDGSPQALLVSILDPNRAVESKYVNYLVETNDGDRLTGIIMSETSTSITLASVDGQRRQILRRDIAELRSTGLSLMPQGLEQAIPPAAMADLFAYIASTGPAAKKFDNNSPRTIEADANGVLTLPAAAAAVYGKTLIFEQQYRNLGYWSSEDDRAVWTIIVPRDGKYEVTLDHSLANNIKSNPFILQVGDQQLTGNVKNTGTWDDYQTTKIGSITLKAGTHRVVFRSNGPINGALIDLRTIMLTPQ